MRYLYSLLVLCSYVAGFSQDHPCSVHKQSYYSKQFASAAKSAAAPQISHDMDYDMKFVHLDLKIERNTKAMSGNVKTVATVTATALDTFMTLLHKVLIIDSIYFNASKVTFIRQDSMVKVGFVTPLVNGATFTAQVYYKGTPPNGGAAIGSGFSNGSSGSWGNQATWSLSESFVAYHWWPCKQVLSDKIDSSWVYITTDSNNLAGSNGVLKNVVTIGNKKRFEWKSKYPIDYYLISIAVARYKQYNIYAKPQYLVNDSILIQNFIYDNAINNSAWTTTQKLELDQLPAQMEFLCDMYGMYPFYKEKYGNCMAPFGGGMEHQTMTSQGFFDYYIDAHELGHQWWGDNVTCRSWGDIWINEGFASYTEHLVAEYLDPVNFATNLNAAHTNVMSLPGGKIYFTGSDTMNTTRIFSSRLTYDKGGAIIHSLRFLTNNDSAWYNTLRGFQNTYKKSTATAVDFQNYYQAQTGINPTIFFNQWYYGEGYPTFTVKFNSTGNNCFIQSSQSVSMPGVTPLFITPMQYRISRTGKPDTIVRVMHSKAVEFYIIPLSGTVTGIGVDPNNWIINKTGNISKDPLLFPPNPVGFEQSNLISHEFTIGPNPVKNELNIQSTTGFVGMAELFDIQGKLLDRKKLEEKIVFSLQHLPAGVYMISLKDQEGKAIRTEKILKD